MTATTGSNEQEANGTTSPYPTIHAVDGVGGLTPDMLRTDGSDYKPVGRRPSLKTAVLFGGPLHGDTVDVQGTALATLGYLDIKGTHRTWKGCYKWDITEPDGEIIGVWTSSFPAETGA